MRVQFRLTDRAISKQCNHKTTMRKIPFCKVLCDGNEQSYVREVIESGWLTTAGKCFEFEKQFAEKVQGKYACAVNSATAALHLGGHEPRPLHDRGESVHVHDAAEGGVDIR